MKSKQAKAHEFSQATRKMIYERDGGCIFCKIGYHMEGANPFALTMRSIMHLIPRSAGGLGIPENGAVGCQWHHEMLDNGNAGRRQEMMKIFEEYLRKWYPRWNRADLTYSKWNF